MDDWWKNPVLAGPENDYGDYDYLIEPMPQNRAEWDSYYCRCDDCRHYRKLAYHATAYWRTLDGYDCDTYVTCWRCFLKEKFYKLPRRLWRKTKRYVKATWMATVSDVKQIVKFAELSHRKPKVFLAMVKASRSSFGNVKWWYKILS